MDKISQTSDISDKILVIMQKKKDLETQLQVISNSRTKDYETISSLKMGIRIYEEVIELLTK